MLFEKHNGAVVIREDLGKQIQDAVSGIISTKQSPVDGIICSLDDDGKLKLDFNSTCVGGRRFIQEKIHGKTPRAGQRYTANKFWGIHNDVTPSIEDDMSRQICAFGVGRAGCGDTFGSVVDSTEEDIFLNDPIPFVNIDADVASDLDAAQRSKYYMRRLHVKDGKTYYQYFLKKVESDEISLMKGVTVYEPTEADIGNSIPVSGGLTTGILSAGKIECTTFYTLEILPEELKDFYRMENNGSLALCRFNELAVFFGYEKDVLDENGQTYKELMATEAFSHVTLENTSHKKPTDLAKYIYYFSS